MLQSDIHGMHIILKKTPVLNIKRCLYVSIFVTLFFPIALFITKFLKADSIFYGSAFKYGLILYMLSPAFICMYIIFKAKHIHSMIKPLYISYYILNEICLIGLSHIFYIRTGSLFFYIFALVFYATIPVFSKREQLFAITAVTISATMFLAAYNCTYFDKVMLITSSIIVVAISLYMCSYARANMISAGKLKNEINRSAKDPLTGLFNRRGLERSVATTWPLCKRHKISTSVIMLDIDFFKKYNDTFGHPAGDRCIKAIANVINQTARRTTDVTSRIGGEEFLVFLQDIRNEDLVMLAKRIQRGVEALEMPHACKDLSDYVTVSIGVAHVIPSDIKDFEYLYQKADKALYHAKENGRNCISMDGTIFSKSPARKNSEYSTPYGQVYGSSYLSRIAK